MTAAGKINASNVTAGDRIIVKARFDAEGHETITESATKTGEGVFVARVIGKDFRAAGRYEARGKYIVHTTAGSFEAAPIQTMWLAPEDNAGVKRAQVEAIEENKRQDRAATPAEVAAPVEAAMIREAADAARQAPTAEAAAEIMGEALGLPAADLAGWVEANWNESQALNLAEAEAAREENEAPGGIYHGTEWASPAFDPEAGASAPDANRHVSQTGGAEDLTLNSHAGKVINMNNEASTETPATATIRETTGSAVVRLMERVHERIRQNHPNVPAVVIVTGAGIGPAGGKWGHFRPQGWSAKAEEEGTAATRIHEMFMAGETLAKGGRQVLQTMLHESAHAECEGLGIQDTSRQGRWHNKAFLAKAQELGLEFKKDKANSQIGFSEVTLTEAAVAEYADLLAELDAEIHLMVSLPGWLGGQDGDDENEGGGHSMGKKPTGPAAPNTNNVKATCGCEEPNIVRMSRKVLDKGLVRCDDCEELFQDRA